MSKPNPLFKRPDVQGKKWFLDTIPADKFIFRVSTSYGYFTIDTSGMHGSLESFIALAKAITAVPELLAANEDALDLICELNEGGAENPEEDTIKQALTNAGYTFI